MYFLFFFLLQEIFVKKVLINVIISYCNKYRTS